MWPARFLALRHVMQFRRLGEKVGCGRDFWHVDILTCGVWDDWRSWWSPHAFIKSLHRLAMPCTAVHDALPVLPHAIPYRVGRLLAHVCDGGHRDLCLRKPPCTDVCRMICCVLPCVHMYCCVPCRTADCRQLAHVCNRRHRAVGRAAHRSADGILHL